jgi:hypothetical protein
LPFNEIVKDGKTYKFATNEYGIAGGKYSLDLMMPDGSWTVPFRPVAG